MGRAVVVRKVPACGAAAFFAGDVKVNERRFDGPGVQRRRSLFATAVLDAGICERRTRLAGPLFRPAGCAVARAGVRRPSRGRRPSRPRDGGRTAVPGPAGGGVRPAGGAGVRSGALYPLRGRMGRLCVQANLSTWHGVKQGEDDGTAPKRRAGRPARGPRRTDRAQRARPASTASRCSAGRVSTAEASAPTSSARQGCALESFYDARVFWYSSHALLMAWNRSRLPVSRSGWWSLASSL